MIKIDAKRLFCPMPVIKIQDEVARHNEGVEIEITCSDPGAMSDIPAWARIHGHHILYCEEAQGEYRIAVKVGSPT